LLNVCGVLPSAQFTTKVYKSVGTESENVVESVATSFSVIVADVKCDFREPNVIRVASTPLYNTFHEVWRFARILAEE